MFKSLRGKLIFPIIGLLVLMVGVIFVSVSMSVTNLSGYLTYGRMLLAPTSQKRSLTTLGSRRA